MVPRAQRSAVRIACLLLAFLAALPLAGVRPPAPQTSLGVEGSTTLGPIALGFAEAFMSGDADARITIGQTGSGDGAAALIAGRCDVAAMSRFMKPRECRKAVKAGFLPVPHVVAMDGVCVIVHPTNPIDGLTIAQVREIYTGRITNWKQLGGPDKAIVPISRDSCSGTFETFHRLVMGSFANYGKGTEYASGSAHPYGRVKDTPGAIGYVGLGFVNKSVKALKVNGVTPSRRTIASGRYPIIRPLFLWTRGYPKLGSPVHAFVTFHLSEEGQQIIEAKGFVPLTAY